MIEFLRKRRVLAALALILLWGAVRTQWEDSIHQETQRLRFHGQSINLDLRERLGQGSMIALLGGFRAVVADFVWFDVQTAWMKEEWFRVKANVDLATLLQPRFVHYWDIGGWHLAWNASISSLREKVDDRGDFQRKAEELYWIEQGEKVFRRGLENNPDSYRLQHSLAWLYNQRRQDYRGAADLYRKAAQHKDAPVFLERFPAIMLEKAGEGREAYQEWRRLWLRDLPPQEKAKPQRAYDKIEAHLRRLEQQLQIPREKRIFPNA